MIEMYNIRTDDQLTVTITVVPDTRHREEAHFVYVPAVLRAHRGDRILWTCENEPFVIQFLRGAPLGRVHYHSIGHTIGPIPVPPGAAHGSHPYAVAVCTGPAVHIDAACPEIIIED